MTPDPQPPRRTRDGDERPRRERFASPDSLATLGALTALVSLVLATTVGGVGATGAVQEGPTVRVTDASIEPGGTATVRVVLTSAPEGLAGYELSLSVVDGEAATIAGANYTDAFGLTTDPVVSEDGRSVRLEAADIGGNVEPGATDVTLATVEIHGESAGRAALEVRPVQFDADGGARMNVSAESGSVVVGEPEPTATATPEPTPTAAVDPTPSADDVPTDTPDRESPSSMSAGTTSGQGGLPLAGVGVTAVALASIAVLLGRQR